MTEYDYKEMFLVEKINRIKLELNAIQQRFVHLQNDLKITENEYVTYMNGQTEDDVNDDVVKPMMDAKKPVCEEKSQRCIPRFEPECK